MSIASALSSVDSLIKAKGDRADVASDLRRGPFRRRSKAPPDTYARRKTSGSESRAKIKEDQG